MSAVKFYGFETGDFSEVSATSGTVSIVTSPVISGAYAGKTQSSGSASSIISPIGLDASTLYARFRMYVHITTNPSSQQDMTIGRFESGGGASVLASVEHVINTNGTMTINCFTNPSGVNVGPIVPISVDTVYLIEMKFTASTTVGFFEWKLDGAVQGTSANINTGSVNVDRFTNRINMTNGDAYIVWDDVFLDNSDYPGFGRCLCRQGKVGTPTYDTFTKVVGATANECWSETPYSATKACTSITNGGAQTMLTESFSNLQTGHGTEKFWTGKGLTINACKVAMIAKVASGSSHSIRRRLNGVNTDSSKSLTTSDAYYDDGIWTDTLDNINSMEIGVLHGADVNLVTIEDMWIMMDVTKFWILGPH